MVKDIFCRSGSISEVKHVIMSKAFALESSDIERTKTKMFLASSCETEELCVVCGIVESCRIFLRSANARMSVSKEQ